MKRKFQKTAGLMLSASMLVGGMSPLAVQAETQNGWNVIDGEYYWYENGVRQGYNPDDSSYRGKEIYDPETRGWYWLDNIDYGKRAESKDVYQDSGAGEFADNEDGTGKWCRYDENGKMVKGWDVNEAGAYYFDLQYGAMMKGARTIDGVNYYFDETSGIMESAGVDLANHWEMIDGVQYWYENGIRQGYRGEDPAYRGKEIYDPESGAWFWLDNVQQGAKAVSKDVYQESGAGEWAENEDGTGKWVRYDENGYMVKGWDERNGSRYYFDLIYGTMAKGVVTIDGITYRFNQETGICEGEVTPEPTPTPIPTSSAVQNKEIDITGSASTAFSLYWTYTAATPQVVAFFDNKDRLNVAYVDENVLKIQRYNEEMALTGQLSLECRYPLFGNIACDDEGNYYVVWGQDSTDDSGNCVVIGVAKYNAEGSFLAECTLTGAESTDYTSNGLRFATKLPFDAGNCDVAVNGGILAVNYAREMYSGHQSNYVFYVDCATMERASGRAPYCSHSFDQRIIAVSDGGFVALNHGDAFKRSFVVSKINQNRQVAGELETFHFREGANRDHGYNETYAQIGGVAETGNAYVFCGSSEKTLSLDTAPTNQRYCGHSEARNLFIQILKKDFYTYRDKECYLAEGESRIPVGSKPEGALTDLYMDGTEKDYGVLWLTDYADEYYVANPKVVAISDDRFVVMWEKRIYATPNDGVESYYQVIAEDGKTLCEPQLIEDCLMAGNVDPVYHNGKIYWVTKDHNGAFIHALDPEMGMRP